MRRCAGNASKAADGIVSHLSEKVHSSMHLTGALEIIAVVFAMKFDGIVYQHTVS